jgi:3-phosphoshikimate 1-carboxyvinyltransferase
MMTAPMIKEGLKIHITSEKTEGSYIKITSAMMRQFGCNVEHTGSLYEIGAEQVYIADTYQIEPDVSAACYFFAAAALTGSQITVKNVHATSMQGDMKFLGVLDKMGCEIEDTTDGIRVIGPEEGIYKGVDVDMNDFSDQALTLAVLAVFAKTPTCIRNIGHIRKQECDRLHAIVAELTKLGLVVVEEETAVCILPVEPEDIKPAVIETYEDHRVAMAFALIGLKIPGIIIDNYECCGKTFENFFEVLETLA